ncbi:MAG: radical SAM protein, partial [Candidatus Moranbacteria bacterium]|nr:radical SAM protein [Candidatus Moranbacteria bacterium]
MNFNKLKKYTRIGLNKVKSDIQSRVFLRTGKWMPKVEKVQYTLSSKCNFRCKMCPSWEKGFKEKIEEYISKERMLEIIDEMETLGIKEFCVTGGEPLLFWKNKIFPLLKHANQKGFYTHFVTNGYLLTKEILEEYNRSGGGHISLSLDALNAEKHDDLRGFKGAYEAFQKAVKVFNKGDYSNIKIKLNFVLSNENLDE